MAIDYRKDRGKWGFRKTYRGEVIARRYHWDTKIEAQTAYDRFMREEYEPLRRIPKNCFINTVNDYLIHAASRHSKWRVQGLSYNFSAVIVPYFGATTLVTAIDRAQVEQFIVEQKRRRLKNGQPISISTVWHYYVDLKALFNYCLNHPRGPLVLTNPCNGVDKKLFRGRKVVKMPLDLLAVDKAAASLPFQDRIYFDHLRFTGARKDEGNRTEWTEHLFLDDPDDAWFLVPGSKTEESRAMIPLPPHHARNLIKWRDLCPSKVWAFPSYGHRAKNYGQRIYHRRAMFERIRLATSECLDCGESGAGPRVHCPACGFIEEIYSRRHGCGKCRSMEIQKGILCIHCGSVKLREGIKLKPKDLRDYYCIEVASKTNDVVTLMRLMRHKSLETTTKYTRTVLERMKAAVKDLGSRFGSSPTTFKGDLFPSISPMHASDPSDD